MLTGRRAFEGEDVSTVLANVLKADPDWSLLPATTPREIRSLLHRCLQKEVKDRYHAAADIRIAIEDTSPTTETNPSITRAVRGWNRAALLLGGDIARGRGLLAALSLTVLVVTLLVGVTQYRENELRKGLRQSAEEIFYNLRALDGNLVRLRQLHPLSNDLREATYRRNKLTLEYDEYIERLGLYDGKSETEKAVLRMARGLGEVDLNVPADFYKLTMTYVERWSRSRRLGAAIARARDRNLIYRIRESA